MSNRDLENDVAILGLGNSILTDEGIGIHLLEFLSEKYHFSPSIDFINGGTAGIDLTYLLQGYSTLIILDAVICSPSQPGKIHRVEQDRLLNHQGGGRISPHHLGLHDLLALAEFMGTVPDTIHLIGIEPFYLDWGLHLSPQMQALVPKLEHHIIDLLQCHGVTST